MRIPEKRRWLIVYLRSSVRAGDGRVRSSTMFPRFPTRSTHRTDTRAEIQRRATADTRADTPRRTIADTCRTDSLDERASSTDTRIGGAPLERRATRNGASTNAHVTYVTERRDERCALVAGVQTNRHSRIAIATNFTAPRRKARGGT